MRATDLADVLRAAGCEVVEVDGWLTRGGELTAIRGGVAHHTATAQSARGDYPTLGVVRDGRAGVPGPLSQLGLGRSGVWYVIASGRANHAGVVHDRYKTTHANYYALGVEAEHPGGDAPWPAAQYASYVRGCAALARRYGITWLGHKEVAAPAGRKTDPNFDMNAFRAAVSTATVSNPGGSWGGSLPSVGVDPITGIEERPDMDATQDARLTETWQRAQNIERVAAALDERLHRFDLTMDRVSEVHAGVGVIEGIVQQLATAGPVSPDALTQAIRDNAEAIAAALAPRLETLSDASVERIRDASVEANERTVGVLGAGGRMLFERRTS